jgi:ATP-dependent RNA circularization protein (DNA/RNA ligase family)
VTNLDTARWLDHTASLDILADLGLQSVPHLGTIELNHSIDELVKLSEGVSVLNPKAQREGIVLRPMVEEHDETVGGRLSFKVINPKFLLKYDE